MSRVAIEGNASGSGTFTIAAPNSNNNRTFSLPDGTGTFVVNGVSSSLVADTAKSATSTSVDFTGIPSWVKRITVMFNGVSTNGSSIVQIQFGTSSGFETTGYNSGAAISTAANGFSGNVTTGFTTGVVLNSGASALRFGSYIFSLLTGNTWVGQGNIHESTFYTVGAQCAGGKALGGILDRVRVTTVNGTDAFDAGSINILYE